VRYTGDEIGCEILFGDAWLVSPNDGLQLSLVARLGREAVVVEY
jgi:DNA polymerase-3 subunit alpha